MYFGLSSNQTNKSPNFKYMKGHVGGTSITIRNHLNRIHGQCLCSQINSPIAQNIGDTDVVLFDDTITNNQEAENKAIETQYGSVYNYETSANKSQDIWHVKKTVELKREQQQANEQIVFNILANYDLFTEEIEGLNYSKNNDMSVDGAEYNIAVTIMPDEETILLDVKEYVELSN